MILGAEIGITIYGLIALIRGKMSLGKGRILTGTPARILGVIGLCMLPLVFLFGFFYGLMATLQGIDVTQMSGIKLIWIDLLALAIVLITINVLGNIFYKQQQNALTQEPPVLGTTNHL
ncbi:MAG: hypothetical protein IT423_10470 [Pirellulaceae bacterium]|nr:hypothetical protein [Pirellulaceae bacterium]